MECGDAMTSVVDSEGGSSSAHAAFASLSFQLARVTLFILALGIVATVASPHDVRQPYFAPWQYAILGVGAWGFIISYAAYYILGGKLAWWKLVSFMFTRARV